MTISEITSSYPVMKMHGCGNDYVVIVDLDDRLSAEQAVRLSDRHYGVGSDGLIAVLGSRVPDAALRMKMYNPDGTTAEMCGNGMRCFVKFCADNDLVDAARPVRAETDAGIIVSDVLGNDGKSARIRVNMGLPSLFDSKQVTGSQGKDGLVRVRAHGFECVFVSMGNPHAVIFSDSPESDMRAYGFLIETATDVFPRKTNVEFIRVLSRNEIFLRVWERGAGETLACGTGACASFVVARVSGLVDRAGTVHLAGGDLEIAWEGDRSPVFLTGDAENVFQIEKESLDRFLLA
jgi:diaminopimelate epimerase